MTKTINEQNINRDKLIERKSKMKEAVRKGKPKEMKDWEWAKYCKYTRDKTKEINGLLGIGKKQGLKDLEAKK